MSDCTPLQRDHPGNGDSVDGKSLRRLAAGALLAAGPGAIVFHVVYGISHGSTVVNENRVVAGLSNHEWARVAIVWMLFAAVGVIGIHRVQRGLVSGFAVTLIVLGLVLQGLAAWSFDLYVPAILALYTGLSLLALGIISAGRLPSWAAVAPCIAVLAWSPFPIASDEVYALEVAPAGLVLHGDDLIALACGIPWFALGCALLAARDQTTSC